jgi:hypothetical protein
MPWGGETARVLEQLRITDQAVGYLKITRGLEYDDDPEGVFLAGSVAALLHLGFGESRQVSPGRKVHRSGGQPIGHIFF